MIDEGYVVYGNHSITFAKSGAINLIDVIDRLDALRLGESEFLREMCIAWHPRPKQMENDKEIKKALASDQKRRLKMRKWKLESYYGSNYEFEGPCELVMELSRTNVQIAVWCSDPEGWFEEADDDDIAWRNNWRRILYRIIHALGGDHALYFHDPDKICRLAMDSSEYRDPEDTTTPIRRDFHWCIENHYKRKAPEKFEDCPICTVDRFDDLKYIL